MRRLTIALLLAVSCVAPAEHELEEIVELPAMPASEWVIDLRDPTRAYQVSGLLANRMAEIELICPDGTEMDLKTWVRLTNETLTDALDVQTGVVLASSEAVASAALTTTCVEECFECPDGAWVCQMTGPGCDFWGRERPDPGDDGADHRANSNEGDAPPQEPRNAAPSSPRPDDPTPRTPQEPSQPPPHL